VPQLGRLPAEHTSANATTYLNIRAIVASGIPTFARGTRPRGSGSCASRGRRHILEVALNDREASVSEPARALTLQLLDWISERPRTYSEVLETWRTTCPRLSIWEDACIDGLVDCDPDSRIVSVSAKGRTLLREHVS
jgi:hypothetical protein